MLVALVYIKDIPRTYQKYILFKILPMHHILNMKHE